MKDTSTILKDNLLEELAENSPWIGMPDIDWSCLIEGFSPKTFHKNEIIYHQQEQPDYMYLVKSGRVRLDVYGLNGETRSLFIAEVGMIFGELSPIDDLPNICSATAVMDTLLYQIPHQHFLDKLHENHEFSLDVLRIMTKKMRLITTQMKQLSFNNSCYRICYALTNLVNQFGEKTPGGWQLKIKFTHQEMANLTGLSRVSVSNIFLRMTADGIIDKKDGYLVIKDLKILNEWLSENV